MSTQYNALDQPFTDKRTMENYEYANSAKPSCSFMHPIECKASQTSVGELYVRTGPVSTGDLRLYDLGVFSIATQGMQNAEDGQVIGELWCTFEIEFYKPKLLIGGGALLTDHFSGSGSSLYTVAHIFGSGDNILTSSSGSNLGCTITGTDTITFPTFVTDGFYMINFIVVGSSATTSSANYAIGTVVNADVTSDDVSLLNGDSYSLVLKVH